MYVNFNEHISNILFGMTIVCDYILFNTFVNYFEAQ